MKVGRPSVLAISVGLVVASLASTTAQEDGATSDIESFRTREIEPGVVRVLDDNAGHDLTKKWPANRRDIDHVAVSPDGEVWLSITASGDDNEHLDGARLWPLGREATYGPRSGAGKQHGRLLFDDEGRLWVIGNRMAIFDGEEWSTGERKQVLTDPDGTVWLSGNGLGVESWDGSELHRQLENVFTGSLFEGPDGTIGVESWQGIYLHDGTEWTLADSSNPRVATSGGTLGVLLGDRAGLQLHRDGEAATVLEGTRLNEVAAAPDGSLWVVGGVGKGNGGVYRVDPVAVFSAREATEADTGSET